MITNEATHEKIPNLALIRQFLGKDFSRDWHFIMDGYEQLEVKGLMHWKTRLEHCRDKVRLLQIVVFIFLDHIC